MNQQPKYRIVIFAKAPLTGQAKTRLSPALGAIGAAELAKKLLRLCVNEALQADIGAVELCVAPSMHHPIWRELDIPKTIEWTEQGEGDLGERLARATQRATAQGEIVLLIGTDCPGLTAEILREAAQSLAHHQACIVPVSDGGYALLGLHHYYSSAFLDMPWSTSKVAQITRKRLHDQGVLPHEFPILNDIDEPSDLQYLPDYLKSELQYVSSIKTGHHE